MAITVYIFYPWKLNLTVQIRFGFIVAIIAALVYTDLPLAVHLVLFSIIFMLLLIMLKKAISYS